MELLILTEWKETKYASRWLCLIRTILLYNDALFMSTVVIQIPFSLDSMERERGAICCMERWPNRISVDRCYHDSGFLKWISTRELHFAIYFLVLLFCSFICVVSLSRVSDSFLFVCLSSSWGSGVGCITLHAIRLLVSWHVVIWYVLWSVKLALNKNSVGNYLHWNLLYRICMFVIIVNFALLATFEF